MLRFIKFIFRSTRKLIKSLFLQWFVNPRDPRGCDYCNLSIGRHTTAIQGSREVRVILYIPGNMRAVFVVLCFVVVMQSFIMNSNEVFIHIHHGCFAGTGAIVRLPQCQWSRPDGYGKISQCITTAEHGGAGAVCVFLGIYCTCESGSLPRWDFFVPSLKLDFRHWRRRRLPLWQLSTQPVGN